MFLSKQYTSQLNRLYELGQTLAGTPNSLAQLRVALQPYAPALFDEDTSVLAREDIIRSLNNLSLGSVAALLGIPPSLFVDLPSVRARTVLIPRIVAAASDTARYPAPDVSPLPLSAAVPPSIVMRFSDSIPLVLMRDLLDAAVSGRVDYAEVRSRLMQMYSPQRGWLKNALDQQRSSVVPNWSVSYVSNVAFAQDARVDVYIANLASPKQTLGAIRALVTAFDVQSVTTKQAQPLVQRVLDYAISKGASADDNVLAILCSPMPSYKSSDSPQLAAYAAGQTVMLTKSLGEQLQLKFARLSVQNDIRLAERAAAVVASPIQIGNYVSTTPPSHVIHMALSAFVASAYTRHPSVDQEAEFSSEQWVARETLAASEWNQPPRRGVLQSYIDKHGDAARFISTRSAEFSAMEDDSLDVYQIDRSDFLFQVALLGAGLDEIRAKKRRGHALRL